MHGQRVDFLPGELFTITFDPRTCEPFGMAPLAACANEVEYLLQAMAYANSVASQAHPKKALFLGEDADTEFVKEVRVYWGDEVEGRGKLPIFGGTKQPQAIELGQDSDQSLFLQWQQHLILIIGNAFGLDPQKLNILASTNRSTGAQMDDATDESALRPIAACIENAINNFFLRRYDLYDVAEFQFRFTTSATDKKALAVLHQIRLQDDSMTINESRDEMGDPPLPNDPETGKSKGDYTLTEYRSRYGVDNTFQITDNITPQPGQPNEGSNDMVPKDQQGNNGVNSAKAPKEQSLNKGDELNTEKPKTNS
jgi:hypothetical protein